jgi:hypothetical protein
MSKISQLGPLLADETASSDLFVMVNLVQGDNGTKNITRSELAKALQKEPFTNINITGGTINNVTMSNSVINTTSIASPTISNPAITGGSISSATINTSTINNSALNQPIFGNLNEYAAPLDDNDEFIIREAQNGSTVTIKFSDLNDEIAEQLKKVNKVYVAADADAGGNGSYMKPYQTLEQAFAFMNSINYPISISVMPGNYYTEGNLSLPDKCSVVSTNGQYATNIHLYDPTNGPGVDWYLHDPIEENCFLVGSGCYIQGFGFRNMRVDDFDDPTKGFAVAFRPGATILRSPYIKDCSQVSNYTERAIAAPLDPVNANPLVGRGGGVLLADRAVLDYDTIFPYMLAFGATPRSPNGMGYVAKNGAGINGIGSITIFQRCAFYALNGGQVTLNNSGTQFGDISMRAKGFTYVVEPYELTGVEKNDLIFANTAAETIDNARDDIIEDMWERIYSDYVVGLGYEIDEALTRRDANSFIQSIYYDLISAGQTSSRNFAASFFDYKADHVFQVFNPSDEDAIYIGSVSAISGEGGLPDANTVEPNSAYIVYDPDGEPINIYKGDVYVSDGSTWTNTGPNDTTLLDSFIFAYERMKIYMLTLTADTAQQDMISTLINNIIIKTLLNPSKLLFGSLIESLAHQFNLAGAGVNKNALPLNFRRVGKPLPASGSVLKEDSGRVRWSGADELNNQYFAGGLKINGRTGRLEGRPFTSSVRRLARRAANSRVSIT